MAGRVVRLIPSQRVSKRTGTKSGYYAELDGYLFFNTESKNTVSFGWRHYWKCKNCKARLTTTDDDTVVSVGAHSCEESIKEVSNLLIKAQVREEVTTTDKKPADIVAPVLNNASKLVTLPSKSNLGQIARRSKKTAANELPIPRRPEDFAVPNELKDYENGLFYRGPTDNGNRHHVFASEEGLELLARRRHWFGDGTFRVVPGLFYQLYTIHVQWKKSQKTIPVVYVLMSGKSKRDYVEVFEFLKSLRPTVKSKTYTSDFESACIGAIEAVFPGVRTHGCYFHLAQSFRRQADEHGLRNTLNDNDQLMFDFKKLRAIAFVPVADVYKTWDAIVGAVDHRLDPIVDWFQKTYIGKKNRKHGRSRPRFKPELWNIYERTLNGEQRTNNTLEGYHNGINQHYDCAHPNIWLFLLKLKTFQMKVDVTVRELHEKGPTVKRRATIYDHQQSLCQRCEEFSPTDFVSKIAKLL